MKVRAHLSGFDGRDFQRAIGKLDKRKARSALNRALNQALTPTRKAARANVDANVGRRSGQGKKQIKTTSSRTRVERLLSRKNLPFDARKAFGRDSQVAMIYLEEGGKGRPGFYLRFWEFGFTRRGIHYAARPWFRPAWDSTVNGIIRVYEQKAGKIIEREAAKRK